MFRWIFHVRPVWTQVILASGRGIVVLASTLKADALDSNLLNCEKRDEKACFYDFIVVFEHHSKYMVERTFFVVTREKAHTNAHCIQPSNLANTGVTDRHEAIKFFYHSTYSYQVSVSFTLMC